VTAAIHATRLTKRYGDTVALNGLDLIVKEGEVCGSLGPNGSGKMTTIWLLLGLQPVQRAVKLFGIDARNEPVSAP
jgi:ABC-2 type transport system ATP-binding protein